MQVEWAFSFAGSPWTEDLWSGGAGSSWEDKLHLGHQGARAWERPCERNRWVFRGPARKIALGLVGGPGREHSGMRATMRLLGGCRIEGGGWQGGGGDHSWSQLRTRTFVFERHTVSIKTCICGLYLLDASYRNDNETCTECLLCAKSCARCSIFISIFL